MELIKIEALLRKYEEGTTSLAEEEQLRTFFTTGQVPEHLKSYELLFSFSSKAKNITYTGKPAFGFKPQENKRKRKFYAYAGIAASILLIASVFTFQELHENQYSDKELGTVQDPQEAYQQAKQTLAMVSQVLNNSKEDLVYIKEFNNTKNQFIKE